MQADGGEWKEELLFKVPMDHPEIQRMANRYKRCALLVRMNESDQIVIVGSSWDTHTERIDRVLEWRLPRTIPMLFYVILHKYSRRVPPYRLIPCI